MNEPDGASVRFAGRSLHLLLRMSDAEAVAHHRAVAQRVGAVWWPRYGPRRAAPTRRQLLLQHQLAHGVETWVYLLDGCSAHRARLEAISFDADGVDPGRLASGFDPTRPLSGLFLLRGFGETSRRAVVDGLVLDSAPTPGGLGKSLRGSQATLYVRHLQPVPPPPVEDDLASDDLAPDGLPA
jgi:hypothetical protein